MYVCNSLGRREGQLTFSHRLCKLFACHVRSVLSWVRYLTDSTLRLNSRDYVRGRSAICNTDNALNLSSIRIEPLSDAYVSNSGQAGVAVTVHRSTISNFARNKSDVEPAFEVPKPVTILAPACDAQMDTYSICRMEAKAECRSRARSVSARSWRKSGQGTAIFTS